MSETNPIKSLPEININAEYLQRKAKEDFDTELNESELDYLLYEGLCEPIEEVVLEKIHLLINEEIGH